MAGPKLSRVIFAFLHGRADTATSPSIRKQRLQDLAKNTARLMFPDAGNVRKLAVFFAKSCNLCFRILGDVAVSALPCRNAKITRESFGPAIEDDLICYRRADHRADDLRSALFQRAEAAANGIHIIEDVSAGTDLGVLRHEMRSKRGWSRTAGNDLGFQAILFPNVNRFLQFCRNGGQRRGLFGNRIPDVPWITKNSIKPNAIRFAHQLRER